MRRKPNGHYRVCEYAVFVGFLAIALLWVRPSTSSGAEDDDGTWDGTLKVVFSIVDDAGRPLDEVRGYMGWFRRAPENWIPREEHERDVVINRQYSLSLTNVESIEITFSRDGFLYSTWRYPSLKDRLGGDAQNVPPPPQHVQIVLRTRPEYARIMEIRGRLTCSATGRGEDVVLGEGGENPAGSNIESRQGWRRGKYAANPALLQMRCDADSEGDLSTEIYDVDQTGASGRYIGITRSQIVFAGGHEGDGIQVVQLPEEVYDEPSLSSAVAEILEAPEAGYQRSIDLGGEGARGWVFFFVRVDGYFGKGVAHSHPSVVGEGAERRGANGVEIWMNTEGTRNVATPP